MPDPNHTFYRRVSPNQWHDNDPQTPKFALFTRRPNEDGLSVFDAGLTTPDAVLQHLLDIWIKQDRQNRLTECGGTTKGLRELGWGIVAFTLTDAWLEQGGFALGAPDRFGHLEIIGTEEDFERFKPDFVDMCRRVPESEY